MKNVYQILSPAESVCKLFLPTKMQLCRQNEKLQLGKWMVACSWWWLWFCVSRSVSLHLLGKYFVGRSVLCCYVKAVHSVISTVRLLLNTQCYQRVKRRKKYEILCHTWFEWRGLYFVLKWSHLLSGRRGLWWWSLVRWLNLWNCKYFLFLFCP